MSGITRRDFFKRSFMAGAAGALALSGAGKTVFAAGEATQWGTYYDLTKCDGCTGRETPECVRACRVENKDRFPRPADYFEPYWPRNIKEDWSDRKELTNRLTPYNWTFVQKVKVRHQGKTVELHMPRRCMHCDNPPCANLCPFSAQTKSEEGPVLINTELCLGGAKCRDVCPWGVPARQGGVGLYMKIAPKYLGAGVMYKCNLCYDRVKAGGLPACVEACPQKAISFGSKPEMRDMAYKKAAEISGYIYGDRENSGTSNFYVSPVPFEKINQQLAAQKAAQPKPDMPGFPLTPAEVPNFLDSANGIAAGVLVAPLAGAVAAGYAALRVMRKGESKNG